MQLLIYKYYPTRVFQYLSQVKLSAFFNRICVKVVSWSIGLPKMELLQYINLYKELYTNTCGWGVSAKRGTLKMSDPCQVGALKKNHKFSSENWVYMGLIHNFHDKKMALTFFEVKRGPKNLLSNIFDLHQALLTSVCERSLRQSSQVWARFNFTRTYRCLTQFFCDLCLNVNHFKDVNLNSLDVWNNFLYCSWP